VLKLGPVGVIQPHMFLLKKGTFSGPRKPPNTDFISEGIFLKPTP
jgi:hypothetical protein